MTSSEVWYNVTLAEIVRLEQIDEMLWLNILESSGSVPRELLYLELGILRVRDIIETRRLMFLHHIMHQSKDSLLYRFFLAQARDIAEISKERFKNIVSKHVNAFNELIERKDKHVSEYAGEKLINYEELDMQEYIMETSMDLSLDEKK